MSGYQTWELQKRATGKWKKNVESDRRGYSTQFLSYMGPTSKNKTKTALQDLARAVALLPSTHDGTTTHRSFWLTATSFEMNSMCVDYSWFIIFKSS